LIARTASGFAVDDELASGAAVLRARKEVPAVMAKRKVA
jgi:hypothetical protein